MWSRSQARPREKRIDPYDGAPRTLASLRELCKDKYSEQEILDYWNNTMLPYEGETIHNVANDPFLTDLSRLQRPTASAQLPSQAKPAVPPGRSSAADSMFSDSSGPGQPRETVAEPEGLGTLRQRERAQESAQGQPVQPMISPVEAGFGNVRSDPFLVAGASFQDAGRMPAVANVREDPFITHQPRAEEEEINPRQSYNPAAVPSSRKPFSQKAASAAQKVAVTKKHWVELLFRVIGNGHEDRQWWAARILIVFPSVLFVWTLALGVILMHYSVVATFILEGMCLIGALAMILMWFQGERKGPVSFLTMGLLCTLAVGAGAFAALHGWNRYWRQFWWMQTGFRSSATSALTPAASRADFAVLNFWNSNKSTTFGDTRVDHLKSAGYKDTDYYCVAPILAPASAGATLVRVNYWAVGINCCQKYGGFTCDDAREWDAGTAFVMLDGGMPCPTCNKDKFRAAVAKAEAVHGLVSVEGALLVRWVRESRHLETWIVVKSVFYLFLCYAAAFLVFYVLGGTAWYYGLGIQQKGYGPTFYTPAAERQAANAPQTTAA